MRILALADRAPSKPIKEILAENPGVSLILTLGDLYYYDIAALADVTDVPKAGVYGNHCDGRYMEPLGIENLHLKTASFGGLSFMGFQGCVKYKEHILQSTQEYCTAAMGSAPYADVLVTHCPPRGINDNNDPSHIGFDGLRAYADRAKPRYVFHGHTYDDGKFVDKYGETGIIYVNGWKVVELEGKEAVWKDPFDAAGVEERYFPKNGRT